MLAVVSRVGASLEKPPIGVVSGQACRLPWVWSGLCFGVPFHEASRLGMRDLVTGIAPSTVAEIIWTVDDRGNPVLRFTEPGTAPRLEYTVDFPPYKRPTTELTAYVRMRRLGTPDSDGGAFVMPYDNTDPWETWGIIAPSADVTKLYGEIGIGTTQYLTGNSAVVPDTEQVSVFLRWRSGGAPQLDILGERGDSISSVTGGTAGTGSLAYSSGFGGLRINCHESTTSNYYGYYSQALLWSRRITDVEMAALVADPFGWYSPRRETVAIASPYPIFGPGGLGLQYVGPTRS